MNHERQQLAESSLDQLADRLAALRERYGNAGYPMAQLRELHLIEDEQRRRNGPPSPPI